MKTYPEINMETKPKHTPGPLVCHSGMIWSPDGGSEDGIPIARMDRDTPHTSPTERDANAHRFTLCWNTHDGLVMALAEAVRLLEVARMDGVSLADSIAVGRARAALAAAEVQP